MGEKIQHTRQLQVDAGLVAAPRDTLRRRALPPHLAREDYAASVARSGLSLRVGHCTLPRMHAGIERMEASHSLIL
jgi:hypothetical protein